MCFRFSFLDILYCCRKVAVFEFTPDCASVVLDCDIGLRADSEKRSEDNLALVAPKMHKSVDDLKLQRADVLLIALGRCRSGGGCGPGGTAPGAGKARGRLHH